MDAPVIARFKVSVVLSTETFLAARAVPCPHIFCHRDTASIHSTYKLTYKTGSETFYK